MSKENFMKRAALFVLSLAFILPLSISVGEPPATALTCEQDCWQEAFQCQQLCHGEIPLWACREQCNQDYYACIAGCP
jgi:hypothetical protein